MSKRISLVLSLGLAAAASLSSLSARADEATLRDIEKTFGIVPTFLKSYPSEALAGAWANMKALQMDGKTALPGKYKELIGVAVAAQIPCRYCVYFHGEAAKLGGATERELRESVALAAGTRKWSTVLNGLQVDLAQFRAELAKAGQHAAKVPPPKGPPPAVTDAASAYRDIERAFGAVPMFFKAYPQAGIAGAWREMRDLAFSDKTAIPPRYKELIGLAVASQVPCTFCVVAHTDAARQHGASDAEIAEAVAMAGLTRQWSTWLNGTMQDEATFRREADEIIALFKKTMAKAK
jgi:AhpD family alkylhydroperoxidase